MQRSLEDVAGSGEARYAEFEEQAESYHQRFTQHFYQLIENGHTFEPDSFEGIPAFTFRDEAPLEIYRRVAIASAILGGMGLLFILLAVPRLRQIGRLTR